ncbi:helix-turn-helix domain-containing protein [Corynebacterium macginleyi]|uniref:helix-turn-helix domain-containing protein n=1 Tax=Corynebacterium macginleyi TaxID=38290 RepID=UPI00190B4433|nr:helix-turn-helix domain-containing protein [Corynebacterium macginleyi]MBK4183191.1 hypothetical protein [Corynebacterium macginleyi]
MPADIYDETRQFVMIPYEVLEALDGDSRALALYAWLKKYANHRTKMAHPSRRTLARHLGYKSATPVDRYINKLREIGVLKTFARFKNEEGVIAYERSEEYPEQTSNGYRLLDMRSTPTSIEVGGVPEESTTPYLSSGRGSTSRESTELDPIELDPIELDKYPLARAERGEGKPARQTELQSREEVWESEFLDWYKDYPRKTGKGAARKAFLKARKAGVEVDSLKDGLERSKRSWAVENRPKDKLPYPATWLNAESWDDEETRPQDIQPQQPQQGGGMDFVDLLKESRRQETEASRGLEYPEHKWESRGELPW